jgi:hypothetical protein
MALLASLGTGSVGARRVTPTTPEHASRLEVGVRPTLAPAPAAIRVTAVIEQHNANQSVTLTADCPRYRRSSTVALDGDAAARTHTTVFDHLPACAYEVHARLARSDGDDIVEIVDVLVTK